MSPHMSRVSLHGARDESPQGLDDSVTFQHTRSPTGTTLLDSRLFDARTIRERPAKRRQGSRAYEYTDTEFNRKYPPDAYGEEAADNARVWQVYCDEASEYDKSLLDGWNKTLDILLIFAGLFSAVSTTFIIESYQMLQPDYTAYTAKALFIALSSRNGSNPADPITLPDPDEFTVTNPARWINGLWFTSLVLSLAVALLSILAKQWLDEYVARISAPFPSARFWARRRALYFKGMKSWNLPAFISTLPVLLHVSLFLFFGGLVLFLMTLDSQIAYIILAMASLVLAFYVTSLVLPFWDIECPSRVPLVNQLRTVWDSMGHGARWSITVVLLGVAYGIRVIRQEARWPRLTEWLRSIISKSNAPAGKFSIDERERGVVDAREEELDAYAVRWLLRASPAQEVVAVGVQAVGALPPWSETLTVLRATEVPQLVKEHINRNALRSMTKTSAAQHLFHSDADAARIARYLRSWLSLSLHDRIYDPDVGLVCQLIRGPVPALYDLPLLQFLVRWTLDHRHETDFFLALLKGRNVGRREKALSFLPSTVLYGMTILNENCFNRAGLALRASLHLFHAGQMAQSPDLDLSYAVDCVNDILLQLGVHAFSGAEELLSPNVKLLRICVELWSFILHNGPSRFELDNDDCTAVAEDLGLLITRYDLDPLQMEPARQVASDDDLTEFISFVSSAQFLAYRWEVLQLEAMTRIVKRATAGHASAIISRALAHLTYSFTYQAINISSDAMAQKVKSFADDVSTVFLSTAYPHRDPGQEMIQAFEQADPTHPIIPPLPPRMITRAALFFSQLQLEVSPFDGTMLYFLQRHEDRGSAWQMLHHVGWPDGSKLVVADALAANLCVMRRRALNVSDLIDEFFSVDFISEAFLAMAMDLEDAVFTEYDPSISSYPHAVGSRVEVSSHLSRHLDVQPDSRAPSASSLRTSCSSEIERLARHCGELRPDWWTNACDAITTSIESRADGGNQRLLHFVLQLAQKVDEKCPMCHLASTV